MANFQSYIFVTNSVPQEHLARLFKLLESYIHTSILTSKASYHHQNFCGYVLFYYDCNKLQFIRIGSFGNNNLSCLTNFPAHEQSGHQICGNNRARFPKTSEKRQHKAKPGADHSGLLLLSGVTCTH